MSQLADASQVIVQRRIEGIMTAKHILTLADPLAEEMARTQRCNHAARRLGQTSSYPGAG